MSENMSLCCCANYMEISLVRACSKGIGMIVFALHATPDPCRLLRQDSGKEHTVYTLRIRTAYGRGCGLDVPGSGVQAGISPFLMLK
jgi:hypothetical protein